LHLYIGSDPEFLFYSLKTKDRVLASQIIKDTNRQKRIGLDGISDIAEFRPKQANDPIEHFNNLKRLINLSYTRLSKVRNDLIIVAGSGFGYQHGDITGGHIHFNIKNERRMDKVLSTLDVMLSIPMLFIEQYPNNKIRRKDYGFGFSNCRINNHGFEYRTPCSFILEPNLAKGVFCLAYAIAFDDIKLPEELMELVKSRTKERDFLHCKKSTFRPFLNKIINQIFHLKLYSSFQPEIDYLISRIYKPWNEQTNIWFNYGLTNIYNINYG